MRISTMALLGFAPMLFHAPAHAGVVMTQRIPHDGIQPRVATDDQGTIHLLYFDGEARAGNVFYVKRDPDDADWSAPLPVNSQSGSVVATGTIRGAQLAMGSNHSLHVVWNGSGEAEPKGPDAQTPLLYTRLSQGSPRFEPQRNLVHHAYGLDGGACVAADRDGHVYVAWHAGDGHGETTRRVFLSTSADDGESFDVERPIDVDRVGTCGCCGMQGSVAADGRVQFLYRSAAERLHRDMYLLTSGDRGRTFTSVLLDRWESNRCPMSSEAFVQTPTTTYAAWQTQEQVYLARLDDGTPAAVPAPGTGPQRKHPAMAVNDQGEVLFVWTEGTGWNKGGRLAWQLFDPQGRPTDVSGEASGVPVWSFAAPYVRPDGAFVILY